MIFIDSNVPMYVAGRDQPLQAPARRFLAAVRAGDINTCTGTAVLPEILYRYAALRRLDLAREGYDLFVEICPAVLPVTLADTDRARDLLASGTGVRDAIHAVVMLNNGVSEIATFDQGFDSVPGITRIERRDRGTGWLPRGAARPERGTVSAHDDRRRSGLNPAGVREGGHAVPDSARHRYDAAHHRRDRGADLPGVHDRDGRGRIPRCDAVISGSEARSR